MLDGQAKSETILFPSIEMLVKILSLSISFLMFLANKWKIKRFYCFKQTKPGVLAQKHAEQVIVIAIANGMTNLKRSRDAFDLANQSLAKKLNHVTKGSVPRATVWSPVNIVSEMVTHKNMTQTTCKEFNPLVPTKLKIDGI